MRKSLKKVRSFLHCAASSQLLHCTGETKWLTNSAVISIGFVVFKFLPRHQSLIRELYFETQTHTVTHWNCPSMIPKFIILIPKLIFSAMIQWIIMINKTALRLKFSIGAVWSVAISQCIGYFSGSCCGLVSLTLAQVSESIMGVMYGLLKQWNHSGTGCFVVDCDSLKGNILRTSLHEDSAFIFLHGRFSWAESTDRSCMIEKERRNCKRHLRRVQKSTIRVDYTDLTPIETTTRSQFSKTAKIKKGGKISAW